MSEFTAKEREARVAVLLEQRKLASGDDTTTINLEIQQHRNQLKAMTESVLAKSPESLAAESELDSLMSSFSKLRVTAKTHRLRGSTATEDEKERVEEELNNILDQVTVAKSKHRAHQAGVDAADDALVDPWLGVTTAAERRGRAAAGGSGSAAAAAAAGGDQRRGSRTGICHDTTGIMGRHRNPQDKTHPECPGRLLSIMEAVRATGLYNECVEIPGRKAQQDELLAVHAPEHMEEVERLRNQEHRDHVKQKYARESVYANEFTTDAAYLSCGASLATVEAVMRGDIQNGLVVARPPGHHAEPCQCMGFCIFNNVAVAAAHAFNYSSAVSSKKKSVDGDKVTSDAASGAASGAASDATSVDCQRVLIVDWDVHHGNGTQRMFYDNPNVMYVSLHRYDDGKFYPPSKDGGPTMIGASGAEGTNLNVGWNTNRIGDADYLAAFDFCVMPACREFAPDLVLVSAGFDAARGDPLGGCDVTPSGYGQLLHSLSSLADGRVVVVLEGGYNLRSIAASTVACLNVLVGGTAPRVDHDEQGQGGARRTPSKEAMRSITATIRAHRELAKKEWALRFPMIGEEEKEEEEEEEELNEVVEETAEQLGKKMHMRAMFERMRAKREAAKKGSSGEEMKQANDSAVGERTKSKK
jgi:acetoin utilization deacetylase AcuC-like enzyme